MWWSAYIIVLRASILSVFLRFFPIVFRNCSDGVLFYVLHFITITDATVISQQRKLCYMLQIIFFFLILSTYRTDGKLELRHALEGHQLGVVSVDINRNGTCILIENIWPILKTICTIRHYIAEILLKLALNTNQSII